MTTFVLLLGAWLAVGVVACAVFHGARSMVAAAARRTTTGPMSPNVDLAAIDAHAQPLVATILPASGPQASVSSHRRGPRSPLDRTIEVR